MNISAGYWRSSNLSSHIFSCPIPDACPGGIGTECETSYRGVLCFAC